MAGMPRMSSILPTIKCSTCSADVEISQMGEHICGAPPVPPVTEPMPSLDEFDQRNIPYGKPPPSGDKYGRMPPRVDTSAANRGFMRPGQLTPNSSSSGSRSVSPRTPGGRSGSRGDDYFSPGIASEYGQSPPAPMGRPGGYGGFASQSSYVDDGERYAESPKQASFMDRMNMMAPGPFESRKQATPERVGNPSRNNSSDDRYGLSVGDRPGTAMSQASNGSSSVALPRAPRKNGYGGFGPPPGREMERPQDGFEPQPFGRAGTFPKQTTPQDPPSRTPSAPGSRPDHRRKPSMGPDTSRRPPPRTSLTKSNGVPSINLAAEFGLGNPYHNATDSISGMSSYSASSGRPSNLSSVSNMTSPSSIDSFPQQPAPPALGKPGADLFDSLMNDLQSSMADPPATSNSYSNSMSRADPVQNDSYGRRGNGGVDNRDRDAYARQDVYGMRGSARNNTGTDRSGSRDDYGRAPSRGNEFGRRASPLPSPTFIDPAVQDGRASRRARASPLTSPTFESMPGKADIRPGNQERGTSERRGRDRDTFADERLRGRYAPEPRDRYSATERSKSGLRQPTSSSRNRTPSRARRPDTSRGSCRACGEAIRGKSISSADGRLTGKYHKACFVCTTCREPFSGTTFYVHSDNPYCERHYHQVNGSLCGTCKRGIEGEYLADEEGTKYHPNCFRCADCGVQLRDGYFDVDGAAYCERDAWRRVQPPPQPPQPYAPQQQSRHQRQRSAGLAGLSAGPRVGRAGVGLPSQPGAGRNMGPNMLAPPRPPVLNKRMTRLGML